MATKKRNNAHPAGIGPQAGLAVVSDPHEHVQTVLARCYIAVAEMDYDLARWRERSGTGPGHRPASSVRPPTRI